MPTLDVFRGNAFSVQEMTEAINIIPTQYGLINEMGLFKERGVSTTTISVERKNGVLNVLSATDRGGPGTQNIVGKRDMISIDIPNFTHTDSIKAADVQDVRKFNTENELETVFDVVNERLAGMKAKHEIMLEYMKCGALQGKIQDGEGNVLVNLFDKLGVTQKTQAFEVSKDATDIPSVLRKVKRMISKDLKGEVMTSVLCLCSGEWFDALTGHETVKEAYRAYQGASPLREDMSNDFVFQGIRFVEYEGTASNAKGNLLRFIPDKEAVFLPLGTRNVFETVFGPADYVEAVGTIGLPYYAKQELQRFDKGIDVQTQSNPLPICKRPDLLVKATLS